MNKQNAIVGSLAAGLLFLGALAGYAVKAWADGIPSPNPLYYSGTLTEGGQLVNGTRAITVNLWPDATMQGTPLCSTVVSSPPANVANGRFRIALASSCKAVINQNTSVFVEVIDGATSLGRSAIGAVPYAVEADHAVNATSAVNAAYAADAGHALSAESASTASHSSSADNATAAAMLQMSSFSISTSCVSPSSTSVNCGCPSGEIAVAGGGWCNTAKMVESANVFLTATTRDITAWHVGCDTLAPANAYAMCLKVQ